MTMTIAEKLAHLIDALDVSRPDLAAVAATPELERASALLTAIERPPRARFRVEYQRKGEILAFLREHYAAWRTFDTEPAERYVHMDVEVASKTARSTAGIAALGRAWWATDDPRYGEAFEKFYLAHATGGMFNWYSFNAAQASHELDAYFLLLDCPGFSTDGRIAVLDHLLAIVGDAWDTHVSNWPQSSLGTEGHNWYIHGMASLPFFGTLFPEFARSAFYVRSGWSIVEEHLRGHYHADGGARETTPGYQLGMMRSLWDLYLNARRNGIPASAGFTERLLRATKFCLRLTTPEGKVPSFGDTGETQQVTVQTAALAAAVTGDRECKWYAEQLRRLRGVTAEDETPGQIPLVAFWNVGLEGAATYANTRPLDPQHVSVLMGSTGYAAMRDGATADADCLAIAAATRGTIVTSHGHNDVFSIEVHAAGTRFIGEMGPAPYGKSPGRMFDVSTEAHSTLGIVGMEQAVLAGEWRWHSTVVPAVRRWITEPTHDFFHGVHEGYYRYKVTDTIHARKVFFLKRGPHNPRGYWVVFDWIESEQQYDYRAYFHGTVPGVIENGTILLGRASQPRLAIVPPANDGSAIVPVHSDGRAAYFNEKKLDIAQHPCFAVTKRSASDCLVSVLVPMSGEDDPPSVERVGVTINGTEEDAHGGTAVRIAFANYTDLLCLSHKDYDAELSFADQTTWGFFAFRRLSPDGHVAMSLDHTMSEGACGR